MREESRLKNNMVTSMLRGNAGIIAVLLIIGVALSFLLLGERPGAAFYIALPLMAVGAYVATIDLPKQALPVE